MELINVLLSEKWLPISIVVLSPIAALIIDLIFSIILKNFAGKTKTTLDDKIIEILHQPIFYSLIFIGWMIAISKTPFNFSHYIISLLLTFIIIIWGRAIFKAFIHLIKWYSGKVFSVKIISIGIPLFSFLFIIFVCLSTVLYAEATLNLIESLAASFSILINAIAANESNLRLLCCNVLMVTKLQDSKCIF